MTALDDLSLADLRVVVDELMRHNQDQGVDGCAERNAALRAVRDELRRRVLEVVVS